MARKKKTANGSAHTLPSDDDVRRGLFENHLGKIERAEAKVKLVQKDLKDLYAAAKREKFDKKYLQHAMQLRSERGLEEIREDRAKKETIERWLQVVVVGTQAEMFDVSSIDRVYLEGERAAFSDRRRKPPKELHVKDHPRWMAGFDNGRTILNASRAGQIKDGGSEETKTLGEAAAEVVDSIAA